MAGLAALTLVLPLLVSVGIADPAQAAPSCSVTPVTSGSTTTYTFTSTCDWTAPDPAGKTISVSVVGGGGGGGGGFYDVAANKPFGGGGGGGGQVTTQAAITLPTGTIVTVTVGTGGLAGVGGSSSGSAATDGGNGSASSFTDGSSINVTAAGGSGGKQGVSTIAGDGGASGASKAGGAGRALAYGGGGGGGGGSTAAGSQSNNGANGGSGGGGSTVSGVGYGGGGGGGAIYNTSANRGIGVDGGGNGGDERPAEAGTANRGGGGGGGVGNNNGTGPTGPGAGGAGGSGVVIVTYTAVAVAPTFVNASPSLSGTVGTAYAGYTFTATGTTPITFTKDSGDLPPGLTLASNGGLSGTPTTAGTYTFKVKAANGTSPDAVTSDITITIAPAASPTVPPTPGPTSEGGGAPAPVSSSTPTPTPTPTPSSSSAPVVDSLDPIGSTRNPNIPPGGVPAGQSLLLVNGQPAPVTVKPNAASNPTSLVVDAPGLTMSLQGRGGQNDPLGLTSQQALILESAPVLRSRSLATAQKSKVQPTALSSGTGFKANSVVKFYILPGTYLGELPVNATGAYEGRVPVAPGIAPGAHTLQVNGFAPDGSVRSLSLGVLVKSSGASVRTLRAETTIRFAASSPVLTAQGKEALRALVKKTGKAPITVASLGYVQKSGSGANDQALSTARARAVGAYLRSLGVTGNYTVRGDGVGGPGAANRKVDVTVTYRK